ncbi:MAG TPA: FAD-dependent oxidoreductase [Candidatus Paceibacterota bacterium]|jgi:NADH dehydrogenase|nr:FAD-dependent oxidoreductase [Candidatus Paceibacterota bacterium]
MNEEVKQYEVVIVGGGFAGLQVAHDLLKKDAPVVVTVVTSNARFQYYPSLYRLVVGANINQVSIPLVHAVPHGVRLIEDTYTGLGEGTHTITLKSGKTVKYDYLVLALGSEPNYFGIEGIQEKARDFLSIEKALSLKEHFMESIKKAKTLSAEESKKLLHTIVVGAGPSGIELAGALPDFLKSMAKKEGVNPAHVTIDVLDSSPRVLPAIPAKASARVEKHLKKKGVKFYPNHGVKACTDSGITAVEKKGDKEEIKEFSAGTIVWTAGTKINAGFSTIPNVVMTDRKRVEVSPTLTLPNDDTIYIAGDGSGTPYSGLAQTAIDQGKYVASAIAKRINEQPVEPYEPKPGVFVIPVGKGWAVLNYKNFFFTGLAVWLMRIAVDADYFLSITTLRYLFSMLKKPKKS